MCRTSPRFGDCNHDFGNCIEALGASLNHETRATNDYLRPHEMHSAGNRAVSCIFGWQYASTSECCTSNGVDNGNHAGIVVIRIGGKDAPFSLTDIVRP